MEIFLAALCKTLIFERWWGDCNYLIQLLSIYTTTVNVSVPIATTFPDSNASLWFCGSFDQSQSSLLRSCAGFRVASQLQWLCNLNWLVMIINHGMIVSAIIPQHCALRISSYYRLWFTAHQMWASWSEMSIHIHAHGHVYHIIRAQYQIPSLGPLTIMNHESWMMMYVESTPSGLREIFSTVEATTSTHKAEGGTVPSSWSRRTCETFRPTRPAGEQTKQEIPDGWPSTRSSYIYVLVVLPWVPLVDTVYHYQWLRVPALYYVQTFTTIKELCVYVSYHSTL